MLKKLIKMILCSTILTGILICPMTTSGHIMRNECNKTNWEDSTILVNQKKDSIKLLIIKEVNDYINQKAPKAHDSIGHLIVNKGLEHNIDIAFIMAQTHYETNFGTTGAGRPSSRYSLFGVNGRFNDYNDAVNKYISLLKNNYLTKGRTEQQLLQQFINSNGHRYATNKEYEKTLRQYYNEIVSKTEIKNIQKKYNKPI